MHSADDLAAILPTLSGLPFQGYGYRCVDLEYIIATPALHPNRILYSLGSPATGARFTPRGGMPTIYLADEQSTAFDEANPEQAIVRQVDPALAKPTSPGGFFAVKYALHGVLDVSDPAVQLNLGTNASELRAPWRQTQNRGRVSPTQQLGQALYDCGRFEGLWYESARVPGSFCLAVFIDRLTPHAYLEVYDPKGNFKEHLP